MAKHMLVFQHRLFEVRAGACRAKLVHAVRVCAPAAIPC
jgi:hypothetical protein